MTTDNVSNTVPAPQFHRAADQAGIVEAARQRFIDAVVAVQNGNVSPVTDDGFVRVVLTGGGAVPPCSVRLPTILETSTGTESWCFSEMNALSLPTR